MTDMEHVRAQELAHNREIRIRDDEILTHERNAVERQIEFARLTRQLEERDRTIEAHEAALAEVRRERYTGRFRVPAGSLLARLLGPNLHGVSDLSVDHFSSTRRHNRRRVA